MNIYIYIYIENCIYLENNCSTSGKTRSRRGLVWSVGMWYNYVTVNKPALIVVHGNSISHMTGRELFWKTWHSTIYWLLLVEVEIQKFLPFAVHLPSPSTARVYFIARIRDPTIWWSWPGMWLGKWCHFWDESGCLLTLVILPTVRGKCMGWHYIYHSLLLCS
jgi:hypothetical protein